MSARKASGTLRTLAGWTPKVAGLTPAGKSLGMVHVIVGLSVMAIAVLKFLGLGLLAALAGA